MNAVGDALGCGVGVALGCGVGDALGCGVGVALGVDVACADARGDGDGSDEPVGVAVGVAVGRAVPVGAADGLALADGTELADVLATLDGEAEGEACDAVGVDDATAVADEPGLGVADEGVPPPPLHAATNAVERTRPTSKARRGNDIPEEHLEGTVTP